MSPIDWSPKCILLQFLVALTYAADIHHISKDGKTLGLKLCEQFNTIAPGHSSCIQSPPRVHEGLDVETKREILRRHNKYRREVSRYHQPPAANMQLLHWDNELGEIAQRWASYCRYEHDEDENRAVPGRYAVGQNIAWTSLYDWKFTLMLWHNEYKDFVHGLAPQTGKNVGHYTQMMWATTNKLGCGYAFCNGTRHFYVCNYGPAGNIIRHNDSRSKYKPYHIGNRMKECHRHHKNGLCDCGGKVCYNGGTLDLHTCTCKCINRPWIDANRDCALDCAHARDTMVCRTNPRGIWGKEYCHMHFNVAREYCPVMCNWCTGKVKTPQRAHNKYKELHSRKHSHHGYSGKLKQKTHKLTGENELELGDQPLAGKTSTITTPTTTTNAPYDITGKVRTPQRAHYKYKEQKSRKHSRLGYSGKFKQKSHKLTDENELQLDQPQAGKTSTTTTPTTTSTTTTTTTTTNAPYDITAGTTLPPPCLKSESAKCGQPHKDGYYPARYCSNPMVRLKCPAMCKTCSVSDCTDYYGRIYMPGESWLLKYGRVECTHTGAKFTDGCIRDYGTPKSLFVSVGGRGYFQDGNYRYTCTCSRVGNRKKFTCRAKWVDPRKTWS